MGRKRSALKPLYVVEHWQLVEPDAGRQHLINNGFDVRVVEPWRGEALPQLTGEEAGVMIMGGPQMITEADAHSHAYLLDELHFIEEVMAKKVPLVGVCLGSQMIAKVMGAKVRYHPNDHMAMGFYPLKATTSGKALNLDDGMMVLNGNAQGWDMPSGVEPLATSSEGNPFENQAFRSDRTLALQFHPEVTRNILSQWQSDFSSSFGRIGTQSKAQLDEGFLTYDTKLKEWYRHALDSWFGG
ncbi:MAG: hypothetical protein AAF870_03685 [Pseudomonadota bacterium]